MTLKVYNIQRNGNPTEIRFIRSTITQERYIVVQQDNAKTLWVFVGKNVNNETKRLAGYAVNEINESLNYDIVNVESSKFKKKSNELFELSKNPTIDIQTEKAEIKSFTQKSDVKQAEPEKVESKLNTSTNTKSQLAPTPPSRKSMKKVKPSNEITPEFREMVEDRPSKPSSVGTAPTPPSRKNMEKIAPSDQVTLEFRSMIEDESNVKSSAIQVPSSAPIIPKPSSKSEKKETDPFVPFGDRGVGPMIEEFQISYYDKSGGSNFILIEELDGNIEKNQYDAIKGFVDTVNGLVQEKANRNEAKKILDLKYNDLINQFFSD